MYSKTEDNRHETFDLKVPRIDLTEITDNAEPCKNHHTHQSLKKVYENKQSQAFQTLLRR